MSNLYAKFKENLYVGTDVSTPLIISVLLKQPLNGVVPVSQSLASTADVALGGVVVVLSSNTTWDAMLSTS